MQPSPIPGNYRSGRQAICALVQISQDTIVVRDALLRAEHMVTTLRARLSELVCERKDALDAIDVFADVAPGSLGGGYFPVPSDEARAVEENLSQIERDVRDLLAAREDT